MRTPFKILLIGLFLTLLSCSAQGPSVWIPGWQETTALNESRVGPAVVESGGYIYMIGGFDGANFLNTVEYSKIRKNGTLGPWKYGPSLKEQRAWMEGVVHDGYIYIVGGANSPPDEEVYASNLLASVERAKILPDGTLSPWEVEPNSMVIPRRCNKVASWGNHIYAVGGFAGTMLNSTDRAEFGQDGTLGKWVVDKEQIQEDRYVNGIKIKKGGLYVFGGHEKVRGAGMKTVEWSKISETGELGPWKYTSPLQTERYGLATAYHGKHFYVLGGLTGLYYLDSIEKAELRADGELSPWEFTSNLTRPRINYSVVVYKDWIYAISGKHGNDFLKSVEYATFDKNGDIGYLGTAKDLKAHEDAEAKKKEAVRLAKAERDELPLIGTVLTVLQAEGYTYLEVSVEDEVTSEGEVIKNGGVLWMAAPNIEIDVDDKIRFGTSFYMPEFYSKELQRRFINLFFVEEVVPVK
ncbi:MAG: hypothetical protein V3V95_07025 [Thermodesulfobacteriota bacterium]